MDNGKKKHYDGTENLRMIGNDCKILEANIDTFLTVFVENKGVSWQSQKSLKLRHILQLYNAWADLAQDIRSVHHDPDHIKSFNFRAEAYFQLFLHNTGTNKISKMPYMHYLRNHLGILMETYSKLFNWGYGYFNANGGEHLNKQIKYYEISHTNLSKNRFYTIIHLMRCKQFCFTENILPSSKVITCSKCHQEGHNKKNKICPLHESHPEIVFENSENEDED
ncbi:uncharacterized protein LOC136080653 isoform X1 [Hydra vulgaris]|uniref:Uncharacterized protein LOC136080653 isoform X1 n=2 Tax=Hydra vulgaris TaxID=6087 RepID=A0ABM4BWS6_HYDVU